MPGLRSNSARLSCYFAAAFIVMSPVGTRVGRKPPTRSCSTARSSPSTRISPYAAGRGDRRWQDPRDRRFSRDEEARRQDRKLIDLGGRTVIPGLTDGHIHGIRAALTFGTEVNWIGVPSLKDALAKIAQAAKTAEARILDRRRRRLDRGAVRREAPADTGGDRQAVRPTIPSTSSISIDWLLLSPKAMEPLEHPRRQRRDARRQARARRRQQADRRHRRRRRCAGQDFRQAAEADHGAAGRRLQEILPRDEQRSASPASSMAAASACIRRTTRRCSSCGRTSS